MAIHKQSLLRNVLVFLIFLSALQFSNIPWLCFGEEYASQSEYPMSAIEEDRRLLPPAVYDLFYAIKDSLDYGVIKEIRQPLPDFHQYSRVTQDLLDRLLSDWIVESYSVNGSDYEIIVHDIKNPSIRYKGTRKGKFKWQDGSWVSLGGYLYI